MHFILTKRTLAIVSLIWFALMTIYIKANKYDFWVSDPGTYIYYATECVKHGTMYPDWSNYHNAYIFNPGWVNFIILWIKILGSTRYLAYVNAVFNIGILYYIYKIIRRAFNSERLACMTAYLFMLLPSFFTISSHTFSELPFVFLTLAALYYTILYYTIQRKYLTYAAGVLLALSMWVRPMALAWIVTCLFLLLYKKRDWRAALRLCGAYAIICFCIAAGTHRNFPDYVYKGNTGGINLIMGNNDKATNGGYCGDAFLKEDGLGYIPKLYSSNKLRPVYRYFNNDRKEFCNETTGLYTYLQTDSIWTLRAKNWITHHPKRYIELSTYRLLQLYETAPTFLYSYGVAGLQETTLPQILQLLMRYSGIYLFHFLLFLSLITILFYSWRNQAVMFLTIPIMTATLMTVLVTTAPRYNMIMQPLIVMTAAYTIHIFTSYEIKKNSQTHKNL